MAITFGINRVETIPIEYIEQKILDEIIGILQAPEIIMNTSELAENGQDKAAVELLQSNLSTVLKNIPDVRTYLYPMERQKTSKLLIDGA